MSVAIERAPPDISQTVKTVGALLLPTLTILLLLLAWEAAVLWIEIPTYILPRPTQIGRQIVSDLATGAILPHLAATAIEVAAGLLIAAASGLLLGTLIGSSALIERTFYPIVLVVQTVPKVAIAPLLVIWFGYGISSKVATAALLGFFPVMVNVIAGIRAVDPRRIDLMRMMCARQWQIYVKVRLPNMLNYLFAGLEVAVVFCVIGAIVGEFVGSSVGLGSLIIQRQSQVDIAGVFSVLTYLSLTALALTVAVKAARTKIVFWV
ncbi:ABC transporter permease [Bradyrhizobium vignae]|uniref:Binding-protein-dependent transport systems inner membrane component n=1 Tax=Bradyrhizobium vignae TaxID=1549949 RepID=A0A2U3PUY1_9BRAD|nr:ABC transporter permease [Bradyrhizobium vignae]SPP92929.1 Binding-protein-dependent transport systems inner membrane component [Bradyrhizobium vignae]